MAQWINVHRNNRSAIIFIMKKSEMIQQVGLMAARPSDEIQANLKFLKFSIDQMVSIFKMNDKDIVLL